LVPGVALVGGGEDVSVGAVVILSDRRVDHVGVLGVGHDALDTIQVPVAEPVGQRDPYVIGVVPTVGSAHVGTHIDKALRHGTIIHPGDITPSGHDHVLPGVLGGCGGRVEEGKDHSEEGETQDTTQNDFIFQAQIHGWFFPSRKSRES
jgi:hypothetical protein